MKKPAKSKQLDLAIDRDYAAEQTLALEKRMGKLICIRQLRDDATLGDEFFKLAQALILCSLPYSRTDETKITRKTRLSNGAILYVTFTAGRANIPLPFGADRQLFAWMIDKALRQGSPLVSWSSAAEYLREIGKSPYGNNAVDLKERFNRVSGLSIMIERVSGGGERGGSYPVIERWNLPASIDMYSDDREHVALTEGGKGFGFLLSGPLWAEIKAHHVVLPRQLWLSSRGSWRLQDATLWLYYRCYQAQSETIITWDSLREQFPPDRSNTWRLKALFKQAVKEVLVVWPEAQITVMKTGLLVNKTKVALLPDNPAMNRVRRLK
jgi:hypothetical protein